MNDRIVEKGILLVTVLLVLIVMFTLWLTPVSKAWFKDERESVLSRSAIYSVTQSDVSNIASFKNDSEFDAEYKIEDIDVAEFQNRYIPGDILYYTFIIESVDFESGPDFWMQLQEMTAEVVGEAGTDALTFASNLTIEENSLMIALLERHGQQAAEEEGEGEGEGYYYTVYAEQDHEGFYTKDDGLENTSVDSLLNVGVLQAEFTMTLPDITIPNEIDNIALLVVVPIWYKDTEELQNSEMSCSLTIKGCTMSPAGGGTP